MVSDNDKQQFVERLSSFPDIRHIGFGEVRTEDGNLVSFVPNLEGKSGSLKVFRGNADEDGRLDLQGALDTFGSAFRDEHQKEGNHPNIGLLEDANNRGVKLYFTYQETQSDNLYDKLNKGIASFDEKLEAIDFMNRGIVTSAIRVHDLAGNYSWKTSNYCF